MADELFIPLDWRRKPLGNQSGLQRWLNRALKPRWWQRRRPDAREGPIVAEARGDGLNADEGIVSGEGVVAQRTEESDAVSLNGTVMSVDESSSEGSPDHSTCESSVSASESRKRAAEASPERVRKESSRRKFPGRVTRSTAVCRINIPLLTDGGDDCPGRVLNVDGTFTERIIVGQEKEVVMEVEEGVSLIVDDATEASVEFASPARVLPTLDVPSAMPAGSQSTLSIEPIVIVETRIDLVPAIATLLQTEPGSDLSVRTVTPTFSTPGTNTISAPTQVIVLVDEWGRDTCVINEVWELIETMPHPLSA